MDLNTLKIKLLSEARYDLRARDALSILEGHEYNLESAHKAMASNRDDIDTYMKVLFGMEWWKYDKSG